MLAMAPNFETMYEEVLEKDGCKHDKASEKTAEEILQRARRLTYLYLGVL
jgi:hypothetical protein